MEHETWTVASALAAGTTRLAAAGSESARLDAELLLGHVLGIARSSLVAHPAAPLGTGQRQIFEAYLERRERGEPVAYIRGMKEFYGIAITVDDRVLVPRPDTEALVELAIERIRADLTGSPRAEHAEPYLVWDVGTGSGAIAVAVATEMRRRNYGDAVRYWASDTSSDALAVALINVVSHGLAHQLTVAQGDLNDIEPPLPGAADLLVSNLPYIPSAAVATLPVATSFEPVAALDGGEDGLVVIRRLLSKLEEAVAPDGTALLEIGGDQGDAVVAAAAAALPGWDVTVYPDLSGSPRVVELERADA